MFKNILLPTDGSPTSERAILAGIALAKETGARVVGLYVMPEFHTFTYNTEMLEDTAEQFAKDSAAHAAKFLGVIEAAANAAGVKCSTTSVTSSHPYEAIIDTAREMKCDLIAMASHGRKGLKGLLIGSETQKVLMHSQIPVLVYR
jgi:nucleotide-binding universal stress UspA family protein